MLDLIVLSDLHLGRGKNPTTKRYHTLEAFFYDNDFKQFCVYVCAHAKEHARPFKLILNGDVFDLLRTEDLNTKKRTQLADEKTSWTPDEAASIVAAILEGHSEFVDGLCHILACGQT